MFGMRGAIVVILYKWIRFLNTRQTMKELFLGQRKRSQSWTEPKKNADDAGVLIERKYRNLLNGHISSHHSEVTGEGANILVYTWFGWGGKCNGVRFSWPEELSGS